MPALLFDLDGTIANTDADLHAAMNYVLQKYGYQPVPNDAVHNMIGGGARMILQRGLAENNASMDDAALDLATEELVLWYDQNIDKHTRLFDGVLPILQAAKAAQYKVVVVSDVHVCATSACVCLLRQRTPRGYHLKRLSFKTKDH